MVSDNPMFCMLELMTSHVHHHTCIVNKRMGPGKVIQRVLHVTCDSNSVTLTKKCKQVTSTQLNHPRQINKMQYSILLTNKSHH